MRLKEEREAEAKRKAEQAAAARAKKLEEDRRKAMALAEQRRRETEQAQQEKRNEEEVARAVAAQQEAEREAARLLAAQQRNRQQQAQAIVQAQMRLYAFDLYRWEVLRDVYKNVSYPEWARQFRQEGIVTAEVVIGRHGQLLGITSVKPQDSGILGQELKDAINDAAPFGVFPVNITADRLRITIPYEFALASEEGPLPTKPKMPAALVKAMTPEQKQAAWQQYQADVVRQIQAEIEYPGWARDLKQQGRVILEVTLDASGAVNRIKLKTRSRHDMLNDAMQQAVTKVGGFDAFPEWVSDRYLTVTVDHRFQL